LQVKARVDGFMGWAKRWTETNPISMADMARVFMVENEPDVRTFLHFNNKHKRTGY
jgi:hypothetical protein